MMNKVVTSNQLLSNYGLRKTASRRDVLDIFVKYRGRAISNGEIENHLESFDRITLYRTIKAFEGNGLIHMTVDNNGQAKYALCSGYCSSLHHNDRHAHFHCDRCGETKCMDPLSDALIRTLPHGYEVKNIRVTLSGTCQTCN